MLSEWDFTLYAHFTLITFMPGSLGTSSHVLFAYSADSFSCIAFSQRGRDKAVLTDVGSVIVATSSFHTYDLVCYSQLLFL